MTMNMIRKYDPSSQEDRIELAQNILRSLHDRGFEYKSGGGSSAELVFEKVNEYIIFSGFLIWFIHLFLPSNKLYATRAYSPL